MFVIRAKFHKMLISIANREDPDQTASSDCLSKPFWQIFSVKSFRTIRYIYLSFQAQKEFQESCDVLTIQKLLDTFIESKSTGSEKPGRYRA